MDILHDENKLEEKKFDNLSKLFNDYNELCNIIDNLVYNYNFVISILKEEVTHYFKSREDCSLLQKVILDNFRKIIENNNEFEILDNNTIEKISYISKLEKFINNSKITLKKFEDILPIIINENILYYNPDILENYKKEITENSKILYENFQTIFFYDILNNLNLL